MKFSSSLSILLSTMILSQRPGAVVTQTPADARTVPVHDVQIRNVRIQEALRQIAKKYRVVIGFESVAHGDEGKLMNVSVEKGMMADVLDSLVKADPRYRWLQESDGAIRVYSKNETLSLTDLIISSFTVTNLHRREVSESLDKIPEVADWLRRNQCERIEFTDGHEWRIKDDRVLSLSSHDKSLRENLNQIALQSQTYFWSAHQFDYNGGCAISLKLLTD